MTRINVIPPSDLTDSHLLAEYRELPRVFALATPEKAARAPDTYRMGPGHVLFFLPRTGFLARRQVEIIAECLKRGFSIQYTTAPSPVAGCDADWTPGEADIQVNLARLQERLAERPGFYTFHGEKVSPGFYGENEEKCSQVQITS